MNKNLKSHVKIGDTVQVIAGNQKGFIGTIKSIMRKKSLVFIEGITPRIKYIKNPQGEEQQKVDLEIPIHISNVMLWDNEKNLRSRIGYKTEGTTKQRYLKKSGNVIS